MNFVLVVETYFIYYYRPMKNYLVLLCLLLPISVFAAETDIQTTSVIQTVESPMVISAQKMSPRQALQSGEWTISTLNGKVVVSPGTLTFEKKRFYVKICNGMSGNYRVLGSTLASGGTISTMMYCE